VDNSAELTALREDYCAHGLRRVDIDPDPFKQFGIWFTAAVEAGVRDVNAMTLATVSPDGQPTGRVVLLKGYSHDGFVFYTNYHSEKGHHLEKNPRAGLVILWICGVLDLPAAWLALVLAPGYYGGLLLGVRLFPYFSDTRFRQFALLLLVAVSTGILLV